MNFGERIVQQVSSDRAYRRAEKMLKEDQIDLDDFRELYGEENISSDKKYVRELEEKFANEDNPEEKEALKLAKTFEAIVHEQSELSNWLGEEAITIKASSYDDFKNGVDEIVEFRENESSASYLALAIDITFGDYVMKKFTRIKDEIDQGKLGEVKYFKSEDMNFKGQLSNVPRVVVGVNGSTARELVDLWTENKKDELGKHWIQFQILEEILLQAETFRDYAKKIGQEKIAIIYDKMASKIKEILETKKEQGAKDSSERDDGFSAIKMMLEGFR